LKQEVTSDVRKICVKSIIIQWQGKATPDSKANPHQNTIICCPLFFAVNWFLSFLDK